MKKFYLFLAIAIMAALSVNAQENTYNMVITMANGTTISISPNDVKNVSFNEGELTMTGSSFEALIQELVAQRSMIKDLQEDVSTVHWTIGSDGYWYLDGEKTNNKAIGRDGMDADVWTIGDDGYWYKNGARTDNSAVGQDGKDGRDAIVWTIGDDGYWYMDGMKTDRRANGMDADDWTIGADGYWYKNGMKTSSMAIGRDGKDSLIKSIEVRIDNGSRYAIFTLTDGTSLNIPLK